MKRRDFLKSATAAAGAGLVLANQRAAAQSGTDATARTFYELRLYHLQRGPKTELFDRFYRDAAVPAMNRAGIEKVGVFSVSVGPDSPTMYVLLPHPSLESLGSMRARLGADTEFQSAGAEFLNAPASNPAFLRMDSTLMMSFSGMPKLEVPKFAGGGSSRIFELRTYESHSVRANNKKVEMFNNGEIDIFRHAGFQPVFFGQGVIGPRLPNLTYMLAAENQESHDKSWGNFGGDPEWKKLRTTPGYLDTEIVGGISNVMLRPTSYSQI